MVVDFESSQSMCADHSFMEAPPTCDGAGIWKMCMFFSSWCALALINRRLNPPGTEKLREITYLSRSIQLTDKLYSLNS